MSSFLVTDLMDNGLSRRAQQVAASPPSSRLGGSHPAQSAARSHPHSSDSLYIIDFSNQPYYYCAADAYFSLCSRD
jgi:hypothetical protein